MTSLLSADDLHTLMTTLLNQVGHAVHGDVHAEALFLLNQLERMGSLEAPDIAAVVLARNYLYFGRADDAAITICNALSRRLCRTF